MSQPVKLSDSLVLDARIAAEAQQRSIAGQVEFWAKLGQAVDPLLSSRQAAELQRSGASKPVGKPRPLSELVASIETPEGRARAKAYLESRPYPHYREIPGKARVYVRIDADGSETIGRFVNRAFMPVDEESASDSSSPAPSARASIKKSSSAREPLKRRA